MFRSIREKLLPRSAQNPRRKARRSPPPRRLSFERLEGRELLSVTLTPNAISDGSFEAPALAAKTFQYMPTGSPWQFSAGTGVTSNGSGFTSSNPNAPDGSQVAFVQGTGSMSQTLYLDAGTYNLSFMAAQRWVSFQELEVLVDGVQVGLVIPTSINYGSYETPSFAVSAGMHTVQFLGVNPAGGDNTAFIDEVTITAQADSISNGSFEAPALAANTFQYAPAGSAWQFSAGAGVASNGSAFTSGNSNAPSGIQVAFLQGTGSMSQSLHLDAGTYSLSFLAAERAGFSQQHYQVIQILVDGAQVGLVTPTGTYYGSYETQNFTVTAGTHTIEFLGLNPTGGDNTAFVDEVAIAAQTDSITDGSFQAPTLAAGTYQYAATGSAWEFSAGAGVASNSSGFTSSNSAAPDGTQVAFLQGTGSMSQSVYLDAGTYSLSFLAAQRASSAQQHYQQFQVLVDGSQVGSITPSSTDYNSYQTQNFTVTAGTHTIEFLAVNPVGGDNTALVSEVAIAAQTDTISDGSFEVPGLALDTFQYAPTGSAWQFSAEAGVSSDYSGFTSNNPAAPDGFQVAFLQGTGSMSQSVYFDAGTYSLSFLAAQRGGPSQQQYQQIQILVDGAQVGLVTPASTNYGWYQTSTFTVTAGAHTIEFLGVNPAGGDNTAFVDEVAMASIIDGSFELPVLAANTFQYAPTGFAWQFSAGAGVASNGSAFTSSNPDASDGVQVAFLQGTSSMSQSVYLDAGTYNLSLLAAQRGGRWQQHYQELQVLVDGAQVGLVIPTSTSYGSYETPSFTVGAGVHTIEFLGMNPAGGDNTAFVDEVAITAQTQSISDSGFEAPALAANTFQYAPIDSAWQFSAGAGVASNGSGFTSSNPNAPEGNQVAFVQGSGSMSQSLYLDAGTYSLSFLAAQRGGSSQLHYQELQILVDGVQVALIAPASTSYFSYQTPSFTVTAGVHTVQFLGLNPAGGDNTAFIDQVQIPSSSLA